MSEGQRVPATYRWFVTGDINGFFGLMVDNVTVMSFLAFILIVLFQYPDEIVYTRMFPGTAFGVLFGDLVYTWMAFQLARRSGNPNVTAMPLGLDTPSTIGIAFAVLGPAYVALKERMSPDEAALQTWYIGMATMVLIGVFKLIFSFTGGFLQRLIPQAGLLGSLAGIGLALIGFLPMLDIFGAPVVGMIALGLILYNLVAQIRLPRNFPGVLAAVLLGTGLYYLLAPYGLTGGTFKLPEFQLHLGFPVPNLGFLAGFTGSPNALTYLPIAIPFAILTVVGGINVTESARVAGDDFRTRDILLTEAVATLVAGLCGGVAQSTPYIGQPAYKSMGSRAGYTLLTGLFVGLGGTLGYIATIVEFIPKAVLAPILVFVALDIMVQAFVAVPTRHAPAVAFSYIPNVARLVQIKLMLTSNEALPRLLGEIPKDRLLPPDLVTVALGNGFILTAMLWGAFVARLIDRKLRQSALYLLVLSGLTLFGVIHSVQPEGSMYLPHHLDATARTVPYQFAAGYLALAILFWLLSFTPESQEPLPEHPHAHPGPSYE